MDHRRSNYADVDRVELDSRVRIKTLSYSVVLSEGAGPSRKSPAQSTLQRAAVALQLRITARAFDLSCHTTGYLSHPCPEETRSFLRWSQFFSASS